MNASGISQDRTDSFVALLLVAYLTAGTYKALPIFRSLPDLTLLFSVMILYCVITRWLRSNLKFPRGSEIFAVMFLAFLPGIAMASTDYGVKKVTQTFTLGLLACIAPLFLLRNLRSIRIFLWGLVSMGLLMALVALVVGGSASDFGRYQALNATTISTGRLVGAALIILTVFTLSRTVPLAVGLPLMLLMSLALVGTGSRGPLLGLLVALAPALFMHRRSSLQAAKSRSRWSRRAFIMGAVAALIFLAYQAAPYYARSRILQVGTSGAIRSEVWKYTLGGVPSHPLGIGWGSWPGFIEKATSMGTQLLYPHDLLMEVLIEGGWIAGFGLIFMLLHVGRVAYRLASDGLGKAMFSLLLFFLINALVSDDLISARILFALCAVTLAYRNVVSNESEPSGIDYAKTHL